MRTSFCRLYDNFVESQIPETDAGDISKESYKQRTNVDYTLKESWQAALIVKITILLWDSNL